jgi:hypothetical protein
MKQCPRCKQTYSDDQLNFCLEDGELLTEFAQEPPTSNYRDDAPPTVMMNDPRATNPTNWPQSPPAQPPARWQQSQENIQNQIFTPPGFVRSRDQTLPTLSLILGILSMILICCYGGIWLGLPAAILGYLGMRNADSDPGQYGGRGMAIGGMVLGVVSLLSSLVFAAIAIFGSIVN